jgi:5'-nucleotidase
MAPRRILLTNDDGLHAPGIKALERAVQALGEVTVVAPEREMSGYSQGITLYTPLRAHHFDDRHIAVSGTPADSVILALHHLLDFTPDLLISGINLGANLGENVLYSGTVAGAMEAVLNGVPAVAVSLATKKQPDFTAAGAYAARIAAKLLERGLPGRVMLNINVPPGPPESIRGVRITRMSQKISQNLIHAHKDPRGRDYYWLDESTDYDKVEPESDYAAVLAHEVSVTPLQADRTDYPSLALLSDWISSL